VVATDEARAIAVETAALAQNMDQIKSTDSIPVAVSARHIHLTQEAVEALFGEGHQLTSLKELSQPGQYACEEQLTIIGPKRSIPKVRILGPVRSKCQIEISRTDEFALGIDAPVRASGDVANTPGITLEGPNGQLALEDGIICAQRHIHMTREDAKNFGVKHRDIVEVAMDTNGRDLIFGDVMVRVSDKYRLEMHIDTDEANAAEIDRGGVDGMLVNTGCFVTLRKKVVAV
jgi:acetate kinase